MKSGLALVLVTAWLGCGNDVEVQPDAGPPSLALGTGLTRFEALDDGDEVFVILGPQGGYHLLGSLHASNINPGNPKDLSDPSNPTIVFEVFSGADRVDAMASTYTQGLKPATDGVEMVGRQVILDIANDSQLEGQTLRFVVTVMDTDGVTVRSEKEVIAKAHPNNL